MPAKMNDGCGSKVNFSVAENLVNKCKKYQLVGKGVEKRVSGRGEGGDTCVSKTWKQIQRLLGSHRTGDFEADPKTCHQFKFIC
jgi:hypothetical protein